MIHTIDFIMSAFKNVIVIYLLFFFFFKKMMVYVPIMMSCKGLPELWVLQVSHLSWPTCVLCQSGDISYLRPLSQCCFYF